MLVTGSEHEGQMVTYQLWKEFCFWSFLPPQMSPSPRSPLQLPRVSRMALASRIAGLSSGWMGFAAVKATREKRMEAAKLAFILTVGLVVFG